MKKLILITFFTISFPCFAQEKLLTKKIVTKIQITENKVKSSETKDSITYDYIVNKRFFWEAMDELFSDLKSEKIYLKNFDGDTILWSIMFDNLKKALEKIDLKKYSNKEVENILENEIRAIKFMEEWTYDIQTMNIKKKVIAYCPLIQRDSITFINENLESQTSFEYEIGWIWQTSAKSSEDTLLITRNIQYTIPIYNPKPYRWWDNNLEAEYSIPFFESLIGKADNKKILCYENPDAIEPFSLSELENRKKHSIYTTIYTTNKENVEIETDTVISLTYNSDDIDNLRFGEEIIYDKKNHNFTKKVNYYAPIIRIFNSNGLFLGFYPLYYIRAQ